MNKSLQTLNETTERIWLEIEDQIVRPFVWTAATVKSSHSAAASPLAPKWTSEPDDDELTDEPRNPLRRVGPFTGAR